MNGQSPDNPLTRLLDQKKGLRAINLFIEYINRIPLSEKVMVPYPLNTGITWDTGNNEAVFITQDVVDCAVLFVQAEQSSGLMHISPQTLPDEFVTRRVNFPRNRDVDLQIQAMLDRLGSPADIETALILSGDSSLMHQLQLFLTGNGNAWGKDQIQTPVPPYKISARKTDTVDKIIAIQPGQKVVIIDRTRLTMQDFPLK